METRIKRNTIYKGKVIQVYQDEVELENKKVGYREVVEHNGGACIALKKEEKFLMVRQYRYVQGKEMLEFPAGKLELNENPRQAIERECEEETGYRVSNLKELGYMVPTCGYSSEKIYLYYGIADEKIGQHFDEDEFLKLEAYSLEEIEKMIADNIINDGKTICLVYRLKVTGLK